MTSRDDPAVPLFQRELHRLWLSAPGLVGVPPPLPPSLLLNELSGETASFIRIPNVTALTAAAKEARRGALDRAVPLPLPLNSPQEARRGELGGALLPLLPLISPRLSFNSGSVARRDKIVASTDGPPSVFSVSGGMSTATPMLPKLLSGGDAFWSAWSF